MRSSLQYKASCKITLTAFDLTKQIVLVVVEVVVAEL